VVQSSRVGEGRIVRPQQTGTSPHGGGGQLESQKAALLLTLALTRTSTWTRSSACSMSIERRVAAWPRISTLDSHSAEYFGGPVTIVESRFSGADWQKAFVDRVQMSLMSDAARSLGQLLANVLPRTARVQGVDRDPLWVEKASARALLVSCRPLQLSGLRRRNAAVRRRELRFS